MAGEEAETTRGCTQPPPPLLAETRMLAANVERADLPAASSNAPTQHDATPTACSASMAKEAYAVDKGAMGGGVRRECGGGTRLLPTHARRPLCLTAIVASCTA